MTIMKTYITSVPALVPLTCGAYEAPAPAIQPGDPMNLDDIVVSKRQLQWRENLALLHRGRVSNEELVAAERRHHIIKSLHFDDVPTSTHVPRWAQTLQLMFHDLARQWQQQLTQSVESINRFQQSVTAIGQSQERCGEAVLLLQQTVQRVQNRLLRDCEGTLGPVLRLKDGAFPKEFPANWDELMNADNDRIDGLLQFYDLDRSGLLAEKQKRLLSFLGINVDV